MQQLLPPLDSEEHTQCLQLNPNQLEYQFVFKYFTRGFKSEVRKIEKLRNRSVQKKFLTEIELSCEKYKSKSLAELVKLLFHGTKSVTPKEIYEGNQGLDMRFSRPGMFGQGIYFADSPNYSDAYAYQDHTG